VPLTTAFRCQDYVDNGSRVYAGTLGLGIDPRLAARVQASDLLLVIGARLDEPTTGGYSTIGAPRPHQALIHVQADPDELGRVFEPVLGICSGSAEFVSAARALPAPDGTRFADWTAAAAADARAFRTPGEAVDGVDLARAVSGLCDALGPEAIVTNGAGNYTLWVHRFWRFGRFGAQLAPVSGAMGYGLPAAIAAKLAHPERPVVSFNGDGCFMMAVRSSRPPCATGPTSCSWWSTTPATARSACTRNGATRAGRSGPSSQSGLCRVRPVVRTAGAVGDRRRRTDRGGRGWRSGRPRVARARAAVPRAADPAAGRGARRRGRVNAFTPRWRRTACRRGARRAPTL